MSPVSSPVSFTLRDLNRQPAKVLAAVRKYGSAEVRTRSGEIFTVAPKSVAAPKGKRPPFPDFAARRKLLLATGYIPPGPEENERINRIIAGEE